MPRLAIDSFGVHLQIVGIVYNIHFIVKMEIRESEIKILLLQGIIIG